LEWQGANHYTKGANNMTYSEAKKIAAELNRDNSNYGYWIVTRACDIITKDSHYFYLTGQGILENN
jgi:hypothetical protein